MTGAELGRYLKSLALLNRDPVFGNPELSEALMVLGKTFLEQKSSPFSTILDTVVNTYSSALFADEISLAKLTLDEVKKRLRRPSITKSELVVIGIKRFGIAKSRLTKLPREQVIAAIDAAVQHEESLAIISEEAKRGGDQRSS
ncbi:hypothetical protein MRBLRC7O_000093 [Agrobacterium radiobacter]|uniref:hypothetical protein n=1 Tax=Agrobacterium radiobacter TaxID=362 RepID=UPI003465D93D